MEPTNTEPPKTAGPAGTPQKETETVVLAPTPETKPETKPADSNPVILELSKAEDAPAAEPAVVSASPQPMSEEAAANAPRPPAPAVEEDDSSDDELDDLDDMLDEFDAPTKPAAEAPASAAQEPLDEDWAAQLQAGMADLLKDMNETPEMKEQFDALAKELNDAMAASGKPAAAKSTPASVADAAKTANFQDKIRQAMERMQASEQEVDQGLADTESDDLLAEMLKQFGSGGEGGNEDELSGMLVNMMEQLTSKEVLYEPMKELSEKYPAWIEKNEGKTPKAEMDKYKGQYAIVKQIVVKFEEPTYKDDNETDRQYIIDCMQKMQDAGAPPAELMGDMQQDLEAPDIDPSNCPVQ